MNWDERRPLHVALSDRKKNGRAAKMLSVLRDGEPHTRAEIFERVGYMLTNNAASELRAEVESQGYGVAQWCAMEHGERVYVYQLVSLPKPRANPIGAGWARGSESETFSPRETGADVAPPPAAPEIVEGHRLLDAKAGGTGRPACSEADSSERHPSFAKQLSVFEKSA